MGDDGRAALQRLRAALLASLVLSLAAGAHVLAGDSLPVPALVGALAAVTLAASTVLGRRRLRRRTLVPALVVGQWLLHHAFAALAIPPSGVDGSSQGAAHTGHVHGTVLLPVVEASTASEVLDVSVAMTLAHALAAAVTALAAVSADRAWVGAMSWATRLFPVLAVALRALVPAGAPRARRVRRTRVQVPTAVVLVVRSRRGPPPVLLAV